MKFTLKQSGLALTLALAFSVFSFAQTAREKGIELYQQGNDLKAIDQLQAALEIDKNDAEVWNYLGLAYLNSKQMQEARKALEAAVKTSPQNSIFRSNLAYVYLLTGKLDKSQSEIKEAIRLDPQNANAYFIRGRSYLQQNKFNKADIDADKAIGLKKDFAVAYVLKADGYLAAFGKKWAGKRDPSGSLDLLENAATALKSCKGACLSDMDADLVSEKSTIVDALRDYFKRTKNKAEKEADRNEGNWTPVKFLEKPQPVYTESARLKSTSGTVILAAVFGADAKIKHVIVLKGLRNGLTEQAIIALGKMKFKPATKDGKPIPVVYQIEYTFTIY